MNLKLFPVTEHSLTMSGYLNLVKRIPGVRNDVDSASEAAKGKSAFFQAGLDFFENQKFTVPSSICVKNCTVSSVPYERVLTAVIKWTSTEFLNIPSKGDIVMGGRMSGSPY